MDLQLVGCSWVPIFAVEVVFEEIDEKLTLFKFRKAA